MNSVPISIEPEVDFRRILGHFCSGVVVVTGLDEQGRPAGLTCQSFFSLSLDPPLIAVSPARTSSTWAAIRGSGAFCVNILEESQRSLSATFARHGVDRWHDVAWETQHTGSPVLGGVLAWIDCTLEVEHEAGDHWLVIGRVRALGAADGHDPRPLLYYRGDYSGLHLREARP